MGCDQDNDWNSCANGGESLPSVIDNFILEFFGTITRTTDASGNVTWVLPCSLDAGIPGYPRIPGEGLACYFARILGSHLQGMNGKDAYGTSTAAFVQPAINSTVVVSMNTVDPYAVGEYVWGSSGGFYVITAIDTVQLTITVQNSFGAPFNLTAGASIAAGVKFLPSGVPQSSGPQGIQGPQGPVGPTGPTGAAGQNAFSALISSFSQPAVGSTVLAYVSSVAAYSVGEPVWLTLGGFYSITAIDPNALTLTLQNLFSNATNSANALPGTVIPSGTKIISSGPQGPTGPQGSTPARSWAFKVVGSFTWTCPTGISSVRVRVYGAGGGGGGGASTANGGAAGFGGGGGEYADGTFPVTVGVAYTVLVGTGGGGGTGGGSTANGVAGTTSSFSNSTTTFLSAAGGGGGGNPINGAGGLGGTGGVGTATNRFAGFAGSLGAGGHCASLGTGGLADTAGAGPGGGGGAGSGAGGGGTGLPGQSGATGQVTIEMVS